MPRKTPDTPTDKNRPLVQDIRLLGRILGEVIREQEGLAAFELVERVRQLSVAYRMKSDATAGRALDRLLKNLSNDRLQLFFAPGQHCRRPPPRAQTRTPRTTRPFASRVIGDEF
jgi:hypothetical protein